MSFSLCVEGPLYRAHRPLVPLRRFIEHAEDITGFPYDAWGSYDVLVLPPAFPYGGMENPGTFFSSTIMS